MIEQLAIFGLGLLNISYAISMIICGKILFSGYGIGSVLIGGVFLIIPLSIVLISLRLIKTFYKEMSIKDGGFSQVDLLQDVDAYNISRLYNLAETKLYAAFEDYYNVSKHYKRRYHIFKQQLLKEFDADSIYAVAFRFAKQEIPILSGLFGLAFGKFNEEYIEIVAHAFEDKIETQISIEEYTS